MKGIPHDARAASRALVNTCKKATRPSAMLEVLGAARRMLPFDTSAMRLAYTTAGDAATAGAGVNSDAAPRLLDSAKPGYAGAAARAPGAEAQRRSENDTNGIRRRARETHTRHQLV